MELDVPLDIIVVRKLGVPYQPELAMGAIGEGGVRILNDRVVALTGVTPAQIDEAQTREEVELARRAVRFRGTRQRVPLAGRGRVDRRRRHRNRLDGTRRVQGRTRPGCRASRRRDARAPPDTVASLQDDADEVIVLHTPQQFFAIGQFYEDFAPTPDDEVVRLLAASREPVVASAAEAGDAGDPPDRDEEVEVHVGAATVGGHLTVPDGARAIVAVRGTAAAAAATAHATGSSRRPSTRAGLGTLLFDLLTPAEEHDRGERVRHPVACAAGWSTSPGGCAPSPTGATRRSGTSARARAPVPPSGRPPNPTRCASPWCHAAVVPTSRYARLGDVRSPTLLIVGGDDTLVLQLNREAQAQMQCETRLSVVPGASHLFEEPGTLQLAAELARDWFVDHLMGVVRARRLSASVESAP